MHVGRVPRPLRRARVQQSMGKTGVCWDNALAESFVATYKLGPEGWKTDGHMLVPGGP